MPVTRIRLSSLNTFMALTAAVGVAGCAAVITQEGIEQRAAQATGVPVGSFSISEQKASEAGRIDFTMKTTAGSTYSCYLYSATGFQRAMTFGQTPHSDAICTKIGGGTAPGRATCDALSKAAGRC